MIYHYNKGMHTLILNADEINNNRHYYQIN